MIFPHPILTVKAVNGKTERRKGIWIRCGEKLDITVFFCGIKTLTEIMFSLYNTRTVPSSAEEGTDVSGVYSAAVFFVA